MAKNSDMVNLKRLIDIGKRKGYITYEELNDDLPDDDTSPLAYWFAVKVQSLENDNGCLAESALSVAVQAIKKLIRIEDGLENLEG